MGLGIESVISPRRVPKPPAKITQGELEQELVIKIILQKGHEICQINTIT